MRIMPLYICYVDRQLAEIFLDQSVHIPRLIKYSLRPIKILSFLLDTGIMEKV